MDMRLTFVFLLVLLILRQANSNKDDKMQLHDLPGHMKPFGSEGPFFKILEVDKFPLATEFLQKFVGPSFPLLIKGGAKISPAFHKWTNEYFLKHKGAEEVVFAEGRKKENRTGPGFSLPFRKFVETYEKKDMYLVNDVPKFLRQDVVIPPSLQCDTFINEDLYTSVMWFSSGGTKSVLHNDEFDNLNCLYRGKKKLILISSFDIDATWISKVIDKPHGSYSDVNVDQVDFEKYPSLANMRYGLVEMEAGDCLFIPYKWFHQVNSVGDNLAVNLWALHRPWKYTEFTDEVCGNPNNITMDRINFLQQNIYSDNKETSKDIDENSFQQSRFFLFSVLQSVKRNESFTPEEFKDYLLEITNNEGNPWNDECENIVQQILNIVDTNSDGNIDLNDLKEFRKKGREVLKEKAMEVENFLLKLSTAAKKAFKEKEYENIKKLVKGGYVDMTYAQVIYGERFKELTTDLYKGENLKKEL